MVRVVGRSDVPSCTARTTTRARLCLFVEQLRGPLSPTHPGNLVTVSWYEYASHGVYPVYSKYIARPRLRDGDTWTGWHARRQESDFF